MADKNRPNQTSNKSKNYPPGDGDNAGGITNRRLDEEVDNQESLPARGMRREESQPDGESEMDREEARRER